MKFWTKRNETSVELFKKIMGPVDVDLTDFAIGSGADIDEETAMAGHNIIGYKICSGGIMMIAADSTKEVVEKGYTLSEKGYTDTQTMAKVEFGLNTVDLF